MSILDTLISADEIVKRFVGVTHRAIADRSRAMGLGVRIGNARYFTEDEFLKLWGPKCSGYSGGQGRRSGMSEAPSTDKAYLQVQRKETKRVLNDLRTRSKSASPDQPDKNVTPLHSAKQPVST
jgi:hypothetical protein